MMDIDIGLYDSATGDILKPQKVVDVSAHQIEGDPAQLVFTTAKRGRIVQLQRGCSRIHYFLDEDHGKEMMMEDSERFGFGPGRLPALAAENAPPQLEN
jgi:hypothetical protein